MSDFRVINKVGLVAIATLLLNCTEIPLTANVTQSAVVESYQVVDCLLPGQLRRLGHSSYLTPRRPTRTTAADCSIRGGEYVAYDRSDYKTALKVWLPSAEKGDANAQVNVGEIFERGLGGEPNYTIAASWYQKAALQGNTRGQFNLGTLYEQGLGLQKDKLKALNWYRKAWGLSEDSVIYQAAANREKQSIKLDLENKITEKNTRIQLLNNQIALLNRKKSESSAAINELAQLKLWVDTLQKEKRHEQVAYNKLPKFRQPLQKTTVSNFSNNKLVDIVRADDISFGRYYALVIGVQNYQSINNLETPHADAKRAKDILEKQYGFNVKLLLDPNNATLMKAINDLNDTVTDKDNLLIFYAGHGSRITSGQLETGYWLPSNANIPPDDTYWVSNEFVSRHLSRLHAKRIMVVADSCYAGLLSTSPGYLLLGEQSKTTDQYIHYKLAQKSRLLLSSGGDRPVLDNGGSGHSVFARAFLDTLEESQSVMSGPELFLKVRNKVIVNTRNMGFDQTPEFKAIKGAGHESGDFFFVKKANNSY